MATLRAGPAGLKMNELVFGADGVTGGDDDRARITFEPGRYLTLDGSGFTYDAGGDLTGGTVTRITNVVGGVLNYRITDVALDVQTLGFFVETGNAPGLAAFILGGSDTLRGSDVDDVLAGFAGDDRIGTGDGNDILVGGGGSDRLSGGLGRDVFVYDAVSDSTAKAAGRDRITDFNSGEFDRIDLRNIDANTTNDLNGAVNDQFTSVSELSGAAGELAVQTVAGGYLVLGDVDGGGVDFSIYVQSPAPFDASAILL